MTASLTRSRWRAPRTHSWPILAYFFAVVALAVTVAVAAGIYVRAQTDRDARHAATAHGEICSRKQPKRFRSLHGVCRRRLPVCL